jgi:hypothetical protein
MALALLIAGIFAFLAGLLTVFWGISLNEFSLGSTLIISGTFAVCSGMLLIGLYVTVRELKGIARRLAGIGAPSDVGVRPVVPPRVAAAGGSEPTSASQGEPPKATLEPRPDDLPARLRNEPPASEATAIAAEPPKRRNLLFASSSRKERERAQAKGPDASGSGETAPLPTAPPVPSANFEDAWPKPDRVRPLESTTAPRRMPPPPPRTPPVSAEPAPPPPAPEPPPSSQSEQAPITVLKSGVVDGMAYSLYSDGSIEAQMPEGMMRFASIDELREHLDQRT